MTSQDNRVDLSALLSLKGMLRIGFTVTLSIVFLLFAFEGVSWDEFSQAYELVSLPTLGLCLATFTLGYAMRIIRWWILLRSFNRTVSIGATAGALLAGFALNGILPLRMGDVIRAFAFSRQMHVPSSAVLGTLVIERLLDLFCLFSFVLIAVFLLGMDVVPTGVVYGASSVLITGMVLVMFLVVRPKDFSKMMHRLTSILRIEDITLVKRGEVFLEKFIESIGVVRVKPLMINVLILSFLAWAFEGAIPALILWDLDMQPGLTASFASWFATATGNLGALIPAAPGHLGTFDYFMILGLRVYDVDIVAAAAVTVLTHFLIWLPVVVLGLISLFHTFGLKAFRARA